MKKETAYAIFEVLEQMKLDGDNKDMPVFLVRLDAGAASDPVYDRVFRVLINASSRGAAPDHWISAIELANSHQVLMRIRDDGVELS